jgi:glycosyltransferase involved in cell wall biosynthesis
MPQCAKICLTMIIKNESKIIERCLETALPICTYMTICDTGSTDNTCEIVETFFKKHHVRGTLYHHEWKNFGYNRTLSLEVASLTPADYILCMDADMLLEIDPKFHDEILQKDSYLLAQKGGTMYYFNNRLLSNKLKWKTEGVTHEYNCCIDKQYPDSEKIYSLAINDIGDGGCKADKFERDIRLLTAGLKEEEEKKNVGLIQRYTFYLAQSYNHCGQKDEAIQWYRKRIDLEGFQDERWYAHFQIADILMNQGNVLKYQGKELIEKGEKDMGEKKILLGQVKYKESIYEYMEAYNMYPERAESLYRIVQYYREIDCDHHNITLQYIRTGLLTPFPLQRDLFVDPTIYSYKFLFEASICACYKGEKTFGLVACEKIIHEAVAYKDKNIEGIPKDIRSNVMINRTYYIPTLTDKENHTQITLPQLEDGWRCFNPCMTSNDTLLVRTANYMVNVETGEYNWPAGYCDSASYVSRKGGPFVKMEDKAVYEKFPSNIRSFEDVRIFKVANQWFGSATTSILNPKNDIEMALLFLHPETFSIQKVLKLHPPEPTSCEKNWMPFVYNNELHFVYWCHPLCVVKPDLVTGKCQKVKCESSSRWNMSSYRGGSPGVPYDNGFLFVIHEVAFCGKRRFYSHRFIHMHTDPFRITSISAPFWLQKKTVEFVTGLWIQDDTVSIGYGFEDKEAWIAKITLNQLKETLGFGLKLSFSELAETDPRFFQYHIVHYLSNNHGRTNHNKNG